MTILITGGAGFIGSNFVLDWLVHSDEKIINLDKLTYAGNLENLAGIADNKQHIFIKGDICNTTLLSQLLSQHKPRALIHFAAESHVDRSIQTPDAFVQTNILGTFYLLEAVRTYWYKLNKIDRHKFRFFHVSTDEVYGTLTPDDPPFTEMSGYQPNSPYAASKASSDHLVRAYYHTYHLPVLITHCSNNYGPYQFPEKLIPLIIHHALIGKSLPLYGDGQQIRDWLYVKDHCIAIRQVLHDGQIGSSYNIGGWNEKTNLEVVYEICKIMDELQPRKDHKSYVEQITFVKDRPGHDKRYAIDARKLKQELGWNPIETFTTGIHKTVNWYLEHKESALHIAPDTHYDWLTKQP